MPIAGLSPASQVINGERIEGYILDTDADESLFDSTSFVGDIINILNIQTKGTVKFFQEGNTFVLWGIRSEGKVIIEGEKNNRVQIKGDIYCNDSVYAKNISQAKNTLIATMAGIEIKNAEIANIAAEDSINLTNVVQHRFSSIQLHKGDFTVVNSTLSGRINAAGDITFNNVTLEGEIAEGRSFTADSSVLPDSVTVAGKIALHASRQNPEGSMTSAEDEVIVENRSAIGRVFAGGKITIKKGSKVTSAQENLNRIYVKGEKRNVFRRLFYFFTGK